MVLGVIITLASCGKDKWPCVDGKGEVITESRDKSGFTEISNEIEATVYITQGAEFAVTVEAQSNLIQEVVTRVTGNTLEIYSEHCIGSGEPVIVRVTLPVLSAVDVSGSGAVFVQSAFNTSSFAIDVSGSGSLTGIDSIFAGDVQLDVSGSGSINMILATTSVTADISGSGSITLGGYGSSINQEISGSGKMHNYGFLVANAYVSISGSGNLELNATDLIDGDISGSGDIYYKNTPVINVDISGSGSLIHIP